MRRDLNPCGESDRGDTKPEQFPPKKQNHHADGNAENWNRQIHGNGVIGGVIDFVIPSEVEESLTTSEISEDVSTPLDMTKKSRSSIPIASASRTMRTNRASRVAPAL